MRRTILLLLLVTAPGCSIGEGEGSVQSTELFVRDCWRGPFDLEPSFFAADPFEDTMQLRVQRGEKLVDVSDGLLILVNDVAEIRSSHLNEQLKLALPAGVRPVGLPQRQVVAPAKVSLSLYLYDTCHLQNSALYAVDGWIRFDSLFSGKRNEARAQDRLTEAEFEATMVDPREVEVADDGTESYPEGVTSVVTGNFRFFFQRGIPAQPFP